jgi:uncharacterized cupredoxin-like copper-binding protein
MFRRQLSMFVVTVGCAIALAACGGGGDETSAPTSTTARMTPTAPASTAKSPAAATVAASPTERTSATPAVDASPIAASPVPVGTPVAVNVVLTDFRISAFQTRFTVGQTYTFTIQNNGATSHQFVVEQRGANNLPLITGSGSALIAEIQPGKSATLTMSFPTPGEYQFACHLPGHMEQGMVQANIVVTK